MYNNEEEGMKKLKRAKKVKKTKKVKKPKKVKKSKKVLKKKRVARPKKIKKVVRARKPKKVVQPKEVIKKAPAPPPVPAPVEKVPYTQENATMCICTRCPVQAESACARDKVRQMEEMMAKGMPEGMMPPPVDIPGLYCASGVAACRDLDFSKMCICGGCPVWDKCKLADGEPAGFFCRAGKAH
jgi:hypothetical protein